MEPFYDPKKSYEENFKEGPFSTFADGKVFEREGAPTYTFFGHALYQPFGIPAGPLLNGRFIKAALDKGFDVPVHKTVRTRKRQSHPWPNVLALEIEGDLTIEKAKEQLVAGDNYTPPLSITNSFGNPSKDPDFWQQDIADAISYAKKGQLVMASVEGTKWEGYSSQDYIQDWVVGVRLLKEAGVGVIEANFSCPNEGTANLLCFDIAKARVISEAMKNELGNTPLILKTAYFSPEALRELVGAVGKIVDGFAVINTIPAEIVDKDGNQALPGEGRLRSGVCGHAVKWAGLDMVRKLKALRDELGLSYSIIGVGGVATPADYTEYRAQGADVVQSATGAMWNPHLAQEIWENAHNEPSR